MRQKAFLGKLLKKLEAKMAAQQNYVGVQQLPTFPAGYDERIQYSKGGSMDYDKKKKKGMMYGSMVREGKMGGSTVQRSTYNTGGYASVQDMEKHCSSKMKRNTMK